MLQPLSDRFSTADDSLSDWNPLDYNPLWTHGPQSPFSQMYETDGDLRHSSPAQTWGGMLVGDSQQRSTLDKTQHEQQTPGGGLPEQVLP